MAKILVPTDYSNCSVAALKQAITLAQGAKGSLVVLHVVEADADPSLLYGLQHPDPLPQDVALLLASLSKFEPPIQFQQKCMVGKPVASILATAIEEQVDLIVMGTSGRTGLSRLLMGSVAEEVCRRATCPVLTLKANQEVNNVDSTDEFWERLTNLPLKATDSCDVSASAEINQNPTYALISRAIAARASDVHIDPSGSSIQVRFRIDGKLVNYCRLSNEIAHTLLTQLKVTANFDIADPFHPQEGRLMLPDSLSDYEVRVTSVRVIDGEAISLRILSRHRLLRPMEQLGLSVEAQSSIDQILRHGEGIVLVTGPTGSGKTTTLYSMLHALDDGSRNIVSIEDPVEYDIPTFRQLPVDLKHGITMTSGLKTLLRLDPDVVFVGEIRDGETAETAMRAASSGKYVFSSLHTRDVASTVTAIRDLHIENRSLAANLAGIISQRLLRRLCQHCSQSEPLTANEQAIFRANGLEPPAESRHPVGCPQCKMTGYHDRVGVFEIITSDLKIMSAIEEGDSEDHLRQLINSRGICSMRKDALSKVSAGITSLEEVATMTGLLPSIDTKQRCCSGTGGCDECHQDVGRSEMMVMTSAVAGNEPRHR